MTTTMKEQFGWVIERTSGRQPFYWHGRSAWTCQAREATVFPTRKEAQHVLETKVSCDVNWRRGVRGYSRRPGCKIVSRKAA